MSLRTHVQCFKVLIVLPVLIMASGCLFFDQAEESISSSSGSSSTQGRAPAASSPCTKIQGSAWIPSVEGTDPAHHDLAVTVMKSFHTSSNHPLIGLSQPINASHEVSVSFQVTEDLGANGSITLVTQTIDFPSELEGSAYPVLVSLHDGVNELVNLDCVNQALFSCTGGSCVANPACTVKSPSSFFSRKNWEQHQIPFGGHASINTFPTCHWQTGSPSCAFQSVRAGAYVAKYVLVTSHYSTLGQSYSGGLKVTLLQKKDATAPTTSGVNGAIDLNIVLVGSKNIQASRTLKGQTNLNALFTLVAEHLSQSNVGVKFGKINVYEWTCENNGEVYASLSLKEIGNFLKDGSSLMPVSTEGKALNVFLVSEILNTSSTSTILGVSGAVGGPPLHGLGSSGIVISTFDKLDTYNPSCTSSSCPLTLQEEEFWNLGSTVSHEVGHYLGLNHPSEKDASAHDFIPDTPQCVAQGGYVTHDSCLQNTTCSQACPYNGINQFCPEVLECQFNHVMWWTIKNFSESKNQGDGNLFSTSSSRKIHTSVLIY